MKIIAFTAPLLFAVASAQIVGGDRDANGCIGSAGFSWCASLNKCIQPWATTCPTTTMVPGGDRDANGCIGSAGYTWRASLNKCIRPWETTCPTTTMVPGGDRDANGCIGSAGYTWCASLNKCIRSWETTCTSSGESIGTKLMLESLTFFGIVFAFFTL